MSYRNSKISMPFLALVLAIAWPATGWAQAATTVAGKTVGHATCPADGKSDGQAACPAGGKTDGQAACPSVGKTSGQVAGKPNVKSVAPVASSSQAKAKDLSPAPMAGRLRLVVDLQPNPLPLDVDGRLTVAVQWDGGPRRYEVTEAGPPTVTGLTLLGNEVGSIVKLSGGKPTTSLTTVHRVRALAKGPCNVGPVRMRVKAVVGGVERLLSSKAVEVMAIPGGVLYGPIAFRWQHLAALCLALVLAGAVGVRIGRRLALRAPASADEAEEQADPIASVEEELRRLRAEGDVRGYFTTLNRVLIEGLAARYETPIAKGADKVAVLAALEEAFLTDADRRSLTGLLDDVTRVRFGGARPEGQALDEALKRAKELLES